MKSLAQRCMFLIEDIPKSKNCSRSALSFIGKVLNWQPLRRLLTEMEFGVDSRSGELKFSVIVGRIGFHIDFALEVLGNSMGLNETEIGAASAVFCFCVGCLSVAPFWLETRKVS